MPFYVFAIINPKLKTYAIKVHPDISTIDTNTINIINKFQNIDFYEKKKDAIYKLFNNAYTKQELIFTQQKASETIKNSVAVKKIIYNLIDKIKDGSIEEYIETLKTRSTPRSISLLKTIHLLNKYKNYTLLRKIAKTKDEISKTQMSIRDNEKGITEQQKDRVENIIKKLLDDNEKPKIFTDIMIELIKENENNRVIINRMLDSKQMKRIRNKLARLKKQ
jgi:hypothetical protein